jgi:HAD superfamily 5'-nucleotidase-like hydrolase
MSEKISNRPSERGIFCNRTLNLNSIQAIGYDMDYTLVHYNVLAWEERAYEFTREKLVKDGWPVEKLKFDLDMVTRGLFIDKELGNLVKANRFGYIKSAAHGTKMLDFGQMRQAYSGTLVEMSSGRYQFLDTLFSLSEACMYSQLVDLFDKNKLSDVRTYAELAVVVRGALDTTHMEGILKQEIMSNPEKFVELDPELPLALLDQKEAGKKLMVITNSDWEYANSMMSYTFDRFLPNEMTWRDLFELTIVSSRKPSFFTGRASIFEVVDESGLLKQNFSELKSGGIYVGGNVSIVEKFLGISGDSILYVGDHIFADVISSKRTHQWRTVLIVRELEEELSEYMGATEVHKVISVKMKDKEKLEDERYDCKLQLQRNEKKYGDIEGVDAKALKKRLSEIKEEIQKLDEEIAPLVIKEGKGFNKNWGFLMRSGNDKSYWITQIEKYADMYTSRVSNFIYYTPFKMFRSHRSSLAHDPE